MIWHAQHFTSEHESAMDDLMFVDEPETPPSQGGADEAWTVLVVDDEPDVHQVTRLGTLGFTFEDRPLHIINCLSANEARVVLRERRDIAVILLDVVMETETAGLDLVREIREGLGNRAVRIVLRTGQAGQAPEESVIRDYDINDYKTKAELTKRKLETALYVALRGYRDILTIERSRTALRRTVDAITRIGDSPSLAELASSILEQARNLMGDQGSGLCATCLATYDDTPAERAVPMTVLATTDDYVQYRTAPSADQLPPDVADAFQRARTLGRSIDEAGFMVAYHRTAAGSEGLLYMAFKHVVRADDRELLTRFAANVVSAWENLVLQHKLLALTRQTIDVEAPSPRVELDPQILRALQRDKGASGLAPAA
ncbi:DUF3369 domain-containing protein [Niveibacterium sp. 24ML]|uniref:DUF3369 domain-containing protein n=1 Tax=Niveibacterium sp. 24ML TaxID=2985512 RepID=UPI00226F78F0|nr:DUF3369 domain-containing protein [Niveibacterium sp. 24ML]MCX9157557.1 DUF3369 domain-containing protein [Niveibacterium sp. 24ML]